MILYSVSSLPAGLSLNTSTGVISRTPTAVTVTDTNSGATTTLDVSITVVASLRISTQSTNGATAASYTTPALVRGDCGTTYRVVVSDAYGGITASANATLTLGIFTYTTGNMGTGRQDDTATLLPNGKVLADRGRKHRYQER